jgi:hypothetical protein
MRQRLKCGEYIEPALNSAALMVGSNSHATTGAKGAFANQFNTSGLKRGDQLHERVNGSSDDTVARLHPLDGWHRESRQRRQLTLINANQRALPATARW